MHSAGRGREQKTLKPKTTTPLASNDFGKSLSSIDVKVTDEFACAGAFSAALGGLTEKAASTRERSYQHIAGFLQTNTVPEWAVEENQLTLQECIIKGLKNSDNERRLASRTAALFGIFVGLESENFLAAIQSTLESCIASKSESSSAEALRTWATLSFITGDAKQTTELIQKCFDWLSSEDLESEEFTLALINSIAISCSALPSKIVLESIIPQFLEIIGTFTSPSYSVAIRISAAQSLAMFFEFHRDSTEDYDAYELDGYIDLVQVMEDLEVVNAKKKEEHRQSEIIFNACRSSIEDGFCPFTEVLTVCHSTSTYNNWYSIIQIEWFRDYLLGGFLSHLESNALLHQVFDIDPATFTSKMKLSDAEKYDYRSKNSIANKERSKDRRRNQRNVTLEED